MEPATARPLGTDPSVARLPESCLSRLAPPAVIARSAVQGSALGQPLEVVPGPPTIRAEWAHLPGGHGLGAQAIDLLPVVLLALAYRCRARECDVEDGQVDADQAVRAPWGHSSYRPPLRIDPRGSR